MWNCKKKLNKWKMNINSWRFIWQGEIQDSWRNTGWLLSNTWATNCYSSGLVRPFSWCSDCTLRRDQPGERYLLCKMADKLAISYRKTKSNSGIKTSEIFISVFVLLMVKILILRIVFSHFFIISGFP